MSGRLLPEDSSDEDFDDGEYEASTTANARLGSLFAQSNISEGNSAFVYKPPKPPLPRQEPAAESAPVTKSDDDNVAVKVLYAVPAHIFLLQNGQYVPQGRLGLAILGNRSKKDYKILVYMHNKQPVTQASLKYESQIFVQKNNYVQFFDDKQQFWSVAFDAEVHLIDFLKWYLASKAVLINDKQKEIFSIDVFEGDGQSISYGDSIEIEYAEFLVEDGPQLTEFNGSNASRPLRIKIGKGKVPKGWEEGLIGLKKFGKRLFIIPPDLGYANRDRNATFPTNVPIMVYVLVKRVKFSSHDKNERKLSSESKKSDLPESSTERDVVYEESTTSSGGEPLAEIFKNESESESESSRKADLLSRMAKIGQPMMPLHVPLSAPVPNKATADEIGTVPIDIAVPPEVVVEQLPQQKPPVKPRQSHELAVVCVDLTLAKSTVTQTMAGGVMKSQSESTISQRAQGAHPNVIGDQATFLPVVSSMQMSNAPYMYPYNVPYHPYQFLMPPTSGLATGFGTPFSVTPDFPASSASSLERQNTMIIDEIQKSHSQLQDALTKLLSDTLNNINRKVTDINGNLDLKLGKLQTSLLFPTNSGDDNVNGVLSNKLDNLESLVKSINDNKGLSEETATNFVAVEEKLQSCTDQLQSMQTSINELKQALVSDSHEKSVAEKLVNIEDRLLILHNLKDKLETVQAELHSSQEWNKKYEKLKSQALVIKEKYEERINLLTEHLHRLQQQLETTKSEKSTAVNDQQVKKIMNTLYKSVSSKFSPHGSYLGDDIRKVVLETIKECTLNALSNKANPNPSTETSENTLENPKEQNERLINQPQEGIENSCLNVKNDTANEEKVVDLKTEKLLSKVRKTESEDQEFFDASFSTPPRYFKPEPSENELKTNEQNKRDENFDNVSTSMSLPTIALVKDDDSSLVPLDKSKFVTFPLIDTVPPPLPENEDEE